MLDLSIVRDYRGGNVFLDLANLPSYLKLHLQMTFPITN